uniref:Uncharacterized protein n=1 Tax=Tanacetum cinerariifolium TaxID=118510 RepID=A0A699JID2_TANCI|nr:hypothetical protein [Tanacetum cinerariifolium]
MVLDDWPVRSSLLTKDPFFEVNDAHNVVLREESHRGVLESSDVTESKMNATSFAAKSFNSNNDNNNRRGLKSLLTLLSKGFNANIDVKKNEKMSSENSSAGFTSKQMQKLFSLINETLTGSIHANMAGKASFFNGNI